MDDDEDIFEDQVEFLAERNVWNRVGGPDLGLGLGEPINLRKGGYTAEEKFKLIVLATINSINDLNIENMVFTNTEISYILDIVEKIPDFRYKNPVAFVLGYMVAMHSDYNTLEINKNKLDLVFEANNELKDDIAKVEEVDIVRYTRLCLLHKIK